MKCSKCGKEFEGKFCPECGTPAVTQVEQPAPAPAANPQPLNAYQNPASPQKKKGGCFKGGLIVLGIFVVAIIAVSAMNGKGSTSTSSSSVAPSAAGSSSIAMSSAAASSEAASSEDKGTAYNVGQPATANGITMTLVGVKESNGSEYMKPSDGKVFLLCEFKIDNNSSQDLSISSVLCFEAYVDGYSVDQSLTGLAAKGSKQQLDGKVAAGKKMDGVIAYEVPKDWKELEVQLNPDVFSFFSGKTIFKATHK